MCGIHLIWGKNANEDSIREMMRQSHHRGPDQEETFSPWPGLWIGVNRLKIIHPGQEADQPFSSEDGKSLLLWNGEIYNHKALKSLLSKMGVEFQTESDTEVLLHWIRLFGSEGLNKLEGMFAFIYVDLTNKSLLVGRDRNGEKPLYYSQNQDRLILSSEAIAINTQTKSPIDENQWEHFFYNRSPLLGNTFFKGIKEWKPSRFSQIFQHSTFRWDNIALPASKELAQNKESFKSLLEQVVQEQFHADVPVGMMMSGGADSSLLYATWYQQTGVELPAFTLQVEQKYRKKYSDADAARELIKKVPAQHHLVSVDQDVFWENWEEYLSSVDFPIGDSAGFLTWLIGKEAKKSVKVMITGAGADELWGGYQRHQAFDYYLNNYHWIRKIRPLLQYLPLNRSYAKFLNSISDSANKTFQNFAALRPISDDLAMDSERNFNSQLSSYKRVLDFDRQQYLVQDVLKINDQLLMAQGLEGRAPYLDQKMLSFWMDIKTDSFLKKKQWIRELLNESGLESISKRKKMGFGLPLQEWFAERGEFSKRVFHSIKAFEASHGKSFPKGMRELAKNPESGIKNYFLELYNLFLLAEWVKLRKL
ncbi:asparagine synthase (glutamine-hydrolyzing) [Algoriphagus machipongonensis]|uniref:asparagine synthase (glutamine-hydrolyzing) n=1 Tax=Algoriphagus machipongonensis TaxID=388413 RepID=A3HV72_9BACT|nr:asparagine synthase (glutamine-hydrolyzing) [Algoriphagus machipongonensis]EAZ82044.1 asparagine synthetase B [Algoriphagus machipongonensis]